MGIKGLFIGLMSGTSCDGIDASLIRTDGVNDLELLSNLHIPYPQDFSLSLKKLCTKFDAYFDVELQLTDFHSLAVTQLLEQAGFKSNEIIAVGFHGQTILHKPENHITCQIGNPYQLSLATGIDVIYDFRRRDVSLGGSGAPLVPIFHKIIMKEQEMPLVVVNIGGVANLTYIDGDNIIAFDTGPGNSLIDDTMSKHFGLMMDDSGNIASKGKVHMKLLDTSFANDFFRQPYPKSLDRNNFDFVKKELETLSAEDKVATLTYFSAKAIAMAFDMLPKKVKQMFLCGGGSKNKQLIKYLSDCLKEKGLNAKLANISSVNNLDADFVESQAFGYLAARFMNKLPSAFRSTTGAKFDNICGSLVSHRL